MSIKTKGKLLIILGIALALWGIFLLNSKQNKKISNQQNILTNDTSINSTSATKDDTGKVYLEINNQKIEALIIKNESVYSLMQQLQNIDKINFKEKNYVGMGKFIEEINGLKNNGDKNWIYYVNNKKAEIGVSNYQLKFGDIISWKYESDL